jgi:hypothetical protein
MLVNREESAFEISIRAVDGEWEGKIIEHSMVRLVPTVHLQHRWTSQEAAITGVQRRWRRLFPDETDDLMPDMTAAMMEAEEAFPDQNFLTDRPGLFSPHSMPTP